NAARPKRAKFALNFPALCPKRLRRAKNLKKNHTLNHSINHRFSYLFYQYLDFSYLRGESFTRACLSFLGKQATTAACDANDQGTVSRK
ncbi:hypothetical protein, partial [Vibrio parahaemolyticus]|uniref:hypothetical protein n=1 Tax=Vibrio parahaemolyticus TaxID=670 RepID=UPI001EEAC0F6